MHALKTQLRVWIQSQVAPTNADRELAWRGYVLNTVLVTLIAFNAVFCVVLTLFWLVGQEEWVAVVASLVTLSFFIFTYRVSRTKSVMLAIYMFSGSSIALSLFLSLGWGITDISTNAFYVMAIAENSLMLRGRYFVLALGSLVTGYFLLGLAEMNGWYTPIFYTELRANHVIVTIILLFLIFLGYVTARLIDQVLTAQVIEAARRQELESRSRIAAEVQLKMLPESPPEPTGYDIAGRSIPARDVGGDFYNYHLLSSGDLAVTIGDVTGKGMPAALLMAVTTGMIDSLIPAATEPGHLLATVATRLHKHSREIGMNTACLIAFFKGSRLRVANAGCISPVIRRSDDRLEWLDVGGFPMGVDQEPPVYHQIETHLNPGDWVVFTTDGAVEAMNATGQMLGFEPLEAIIRAAPTHNARAMEHYIIEQVRRYQGNQEQHDDITVVVVNTMEHLMLRNFFIRLSTSESMRSFVTHFPPARATARRFVAGETLDEAVAVVKDLNRRGIKAILNHVGEAVTNRSEAEQAGHEMNVILDRIVAENLDADITFKPSHMGLTFGRDFCFENVAGVVQRAVEMDVSVEVDIEGSEDVNDTLYIYHRLLETFGGDIRQAVQTYLFRTPDDVQKIIDQGGGIRLVKGAYQELPEIAYQQRNEIIEASLRVINQMLSPDAVEKGAFLALGSHDPVLIEALLREATARDISPSRYEIQMLLGVRRDEQERLAAQGYQVRVYVPFGSAWYPYFMRRLAERPANVLFMARAMFGG